MGRSVATLKLTKPHSEGQQEVLDWPGHGVVFGGRRWGKTQVAAEKLFASALRQPGLYWWVGPSLHTRAVNSCFIWRLYYDHHPQAFNASVWVLRRRSYGA